MAQNNRCACASVVAFGEIKRLQRIIGVPQEVEVWAKPTIDEIKVAENQHRNVLKFLNRMEDDCKVNMAKVRGDLILAMQKYKEGKFFEALDKVIDADVSLRHTICPTGW